MSIRISDADLPPGTYRLLASARVPRGVGVGSTRLGVRRALDPGQLVDRLEQDRGRVQVGRRAPLLLDVVVHPPHLLG